jgi:hypothetical protein
VINNGLWPSAPILAGNATLIEGPCLLVTPSPPPKKGVVANTATGPRQTICPLPGTAQLALPILAEGATGPRLAQTLVALHTTSLQAKK